MRQRDSGVGRNGQRRTDAGHYLEPDAGGEEFLCFFAAAPEQKRITAFEPHNTLARPCALNYQAIDPFLWGLTPASDFADVNALGRNRDVAKQFRVDQTVVDNNV